MKRMKFTPLLAVLLWIGCSGPASKSGRIEHQGPPPVNVPSVDDRHEYGAVENLLPSQWARYSVTRDHAEQELTIGVIRREGEKAWIEVIEEGDPRRASLRLIGDDGCVEKAFFMELPAKGEPSAVLPQPIVQSGAAPREPAPESVEITAGREIAAGRTLQASVEIALYRDEELGREYREENVWCSEVPPVFAGTERGGLVRRTTPSVKVLLLAFGDDYKAVVPPPGP